MRLSSIRLSLNGYIISYIGTGIGDNEPIIHEVCINKREIPVVRKIHKDDDLMHCPVVIIPEEYCKPDIKVLNLSIVNKNVYVILLSNRRYIKIKRVDNMVLLMSSTQILVKYKDNTSIDNFYMLYRGPFYKIHITTLPVPKHVFILDDATGLISQEYLDQHTIGFPYIKNINMRDIFLTNYDPPYFRVDCSAEISANLEHMYLEGQNIFYVAKKHFHTIIDSILIMYGGTCRIFVHDDMGDMYIGHKSFSQIHLT